MILVPKAPPFSNCLLSSSNQIVPSTCTFGNLHPTVALCWFRIVWLHSISSGWLAPWDVKNLRQSMKYGSVENLYHSQSAIWVECMNVVVSLWPLIYSSFSKIFSWGFPDSSFKWNDHNSNIIMILSSIPLWDVQQFMKIHSCKKA